MNVVSVFKEVQDHRFEEQLPVSKHGSCVDPQQVKHLCFRVLICEPEITVPASP